LGRLRTSGVQLDMKAATFAAVACLLATSSMAVAQKVPRKLKDVAPAYPRASLERGDEGMVLFELRIAPDGSVERALLLRSGCQRLNDAAQTAVRQWRYEPLMINGNATAFTVLTWVPFRLGARNGTRPAADACVWKDIRPTT